MNKVLASELVIFGFDGLSLDSSLRRFLANTPLGGLILFKRNIESLEQLVALNAEITTINPLHPPLISVDQEGGRVARLRGIASDVPPLAELKRAFLADPKLCYRLGAMMGRELVALGFQLNFAPVCDVAIDQNFNDIIGDRAFSDDAQEAALLAGYFIEGMQGSGLAACAKHFPGHGGTAIDSHFLLPKLEISEELMHERELMPFKAAIKAQVASVMTAHIMVHKLDPNYPATMSKNLIHDLLRAQLLFTNVVISDDLDMKAVSDHYELKEILEASLNASVDMFIIGNNLEKTFTAIKILQELLDSNAHLQERAQAAGQRIERLRTRFLGQPSAPHLEQARCIVKAAPHVELLNSCR